MAKMITNNKIFADLIVFLLSTSIVVIYAQTLAQDKCKEYGKAVFVRRPNAVISVRSLDFVEESECAIVQVKLIIGGKKASEKEFPHMALIGFNDGGHTKWDCGGSLISEKYVLSAAHCMISQQYGDCTMVKLGVIDKHEVQDVQIFNITKRIPHPDYNKPSRYNDIALVELDRPAVFDGYVRPACLNIDAEIHKDYVIASGFGKTNYNVPNASNVMMKVDLSIIKNDVCDGFFASEKKRTMRQGITESMLCAGELKGGKDTCQGDSGGPLQTVLQEPYCMYSIIGVTSFGKFCGFANSPAVYTRVSYFVPWIESIVWNNEH